MKLSTIVLAFTFCVSNSCAHATTLAQYTGGTTADAAAGYYGESFTVTGSGTYNNIVFNYYTPSSASYALGNGYLFSSAYTGTPAGLSPSDPGFLGMAAATSGLYYFASSLTLIAGSSYYFYEDQSIPPGAIEGIAAGGGAAGLYTSSSSSPFVSYGGTADFTVTGSATAATVTPVPGSFVLLGTGLLSAVAARRRRVA